MLRKSMFLSVTMVLAIIGTVLTALALLTRHVPGFYARSEVPPGELRHNASLDFMVRTHNLLEDIRTGGDRKDGSWRGDFSDLQFNSFFAEALLPEWTDKLPEGVSEPRIAFEQDRIRLGFRYGWSFWSTIISIDIHPWLAKAEPNVVVLELTGVHAGSLPIAARSLLEDISAALRKQNVQVTWHRHDGNPTAALKFKTDQPRPTSQVLRLDLQPGTLTVMGQSSE